MAFGVMRGEADFSKWVECSLALGCGHTNLQGKTDRMVLAVPDFALEEMERYGISFAHIREAQLPEYLSSGGLNYYRLLRKVNPEFLYFNAPLPPALHIKLFCTIFEPHLEALRQIVERYDPLEFHTHEVSVETIPMSPEEASDPEPMVRVEFVVHRGHSKPLIKELIDSGAAGTSRRTAIYTQSDPDGPPHRDSECG